MRRLGTLFFLSSIAIASLALYVGQLGVPALDASVCGITTELDVFNLTGAR